MQPDDRTPTEGDESTEAETDTYTFIVMVTCAHKLVHEARRTGTNLDEVYKTVRDKMEVRVLAVGKQLHIEEREYDGKNGSFVSFECGPFLVTIVESTWYMNCEAIMQSL